MMPDDSADGVMYHPTHSLPAEVRQFSGCMTWLRKALLLLWTGTTDTLIVSTRAPPRAGSEAPVTGLLAGLRGVAAAARLAGLSRHSSRHRPLRMASRGVSKLPDAWASCRPPQASGPTHDECNANTLGAHPDALPLHSSYVTHATTPPRTSQRSYRRRAKHAARSGVGGAGAAAASESGQGVAVLELRLPGAHLSVPTLLRHAAKLAHSLPLPGQDRSVALTFDDGPGPFTDTLLDTLAEHNVTAGFFVLTGLALERPDTVRRALAEGHTVGLHTWDHRNLTALWEAGDWATLYHEIDEAADVLATITGERPLYFRPPYGAVNAGLRDYIHERGLRIAMWNSGCLDWAFRMPTDPSSAAWPDVAIIVDGLADAGALICLHDIHQTTVQGVPSLIAALRAPDGWVNPQSRTFVGLDTCTKRT